MADISGTLNTLESVDMMAGYDGKIYATISGRRFLVAYAISIKTTAKKDKKKVAVLGSAIKKNRSGPLEFSGKMSLYYVQDDFRDLMDLYKKGQDVYFDLQVINNGTGSAAGRREVMYYGVNIDGIDLSNLDAEAGELKEDIDFTFEDYEVAKRFSTIAF